MTKASTTKRAATTRASTADDTAVDTGSGTGAVATEPTAADAFVRDKLAAAADAGDESAARGDGDRVTHPFAADRQTRIAPDSAV